MLGRIARAVLRHRIVTISIVLVVLAWSLAGALRLRLDFSSTSFYGSTQDESTQDLRAFTRRWGSDDRTLLIVVTSPSGDSVLSVPTLRRIHALAADLRAQPASEQVTAISDLRPDRRTPTILQLFEALRSDVLIEGARQSLQRNPRLVPLLLSEDGTVTAIAVELTHSTDDLGATVETIHDYQAIVAEHQGRSGLELELAGIPAIRASFFGLTLRDQMIFGPLTAALIGLVLLVTFRRLYAVAAAAVAAGLPLVFLLGLMGWTGETIGLLNQAYFTLIPVIAVADTVHVLVRLHVEARSRSREEAIVIAMSTIGRACLLTTVTTSLGFASLAISDAAVLRHFGLYAAAGLVASYLTLIFVVPVVLSISRAPFAEPPEAASVHAKFLERLAAVTVRRPWAFVIGTTVIAVAAGLGAPRVVVDNRLSGLLEPEHPVSAASAVVDESLGGVLSLELDLGAPPHWWSSPQGQAWLSALEGWATDQPEVRAALGPQTPGQDEAFEESSSGRARVSLRTGDIGGRAFVELAERTRTQLERMDGPGPEDVRVTGTTLVAYRGVNRLTEELRHSLLLVFVVITVTVGVLTRSIKLALASVPVNLLPLLIAYGVIGWIGMMLDPLATVVLTVALGIAVDDTIHLLHRHEEARRQGASPSAALTNAIIRTGRALVVTTVVLAGGLAINAGSSFPPLVVLGVMGASVILLALAADLLLLPALLTLIVRERPRPEAVRSPNEGPAPRPESE